MASTGSCSLAAEAFATLDARGLRCPLPVLKAEKLLESLPGGATLVVLATDPMAKVDIPLYCRKLGYPCAQETVDGTLKFIISKP